MCIESKGRIALRLSALMRMCLLVLGIVLSGHSHAESISINVTSLGGIYYVDGEPRANIELQVGNTYTLAGYSEWHPLKLSETPDGRWQKGLDYEQGVTATDASLRIQVTEDTPNLFYFCDHHPNMGGSVIIVNKPTSSN
jgi:hypothetical protein